MPKIRTTLTIDQDVLARYQRAADHQGESLSRTISGWLEASAEGAEQVAMQIHRVKNSARPQRAAERMTELLKVVSEGYDLAVDVPAGGQAVTEGGQARAARRTPPTGHPPSCNTGGKVPPRSTADQGSK
jgi:hypothetical protein